MSGGLDGVETVLNLLSERHHHRIPAERRRRRGHALVQQCQLMCNVLVVGEALRVQAKLRRQLDELLEQGESAQVVGGVGGGGRYRR